MPIALSDKEASILLGATLMHWGVPFHSAEKHELTDEQQMIVDATSEKLMQSVPLSEFEIALLIEVVDDCLAECGSDTTELNLQLKTPDRHEVETLVQRLRLAVEPCLTTNS